MDHEELDGFGLKNVVVEVLDQMSCAEEKWWLEWIVY